MNIDDGDDEDEEPDKLNEDEPSDHDSDATQPSDAFPQTSSSV